MIDICTLHNCLYFRLNSKLSYSTFTHHLKHSFMYMPISVAPHTYFSHLRNFDIKTLFIEARLDCFFLHPKVVRDITSRAISSHILEKDHFFIKRIFSTCKVIFLNWNCLALTGLTVVCNFVHFR